MLGGRNRDKKQTKRHRVAMGGQLKEHQMMNSEFWVRLCLVFTHFYSTIQNRWDVKDCFIMTQKKTLTVTCFNAWDISPLIPK